MLTEQAEKAFVGFKLNVFHLKRHALVDKGVQFCAFLFKFAFLNFHCPNIKEAPEIHSSGGFGLNQVPRFYPFLGTPRKAFPASTAIGVTVKSTRKIPFADISALITASMSAFGISKSKPCSDLTKIARFATTSLPSYPHLGSLDEPTLADRKSVV